MTDQTRLIVKKASLGVLIVASLAFIAYKASSLRTTGEAGLQVWFYDQSEKSLYAASNDTIPPHKGTGGASGDGVKAIVVVGQAEQGDPSKRRIAYLKTFSPELKARLENVQKARSGGKVSAASPSSSDKGDDFIDKNTLVRKVDEDTWYDLTTPEAAKIMSEWIKWTDSNGQPLIVSTP